MGVSPLTGSSVIRKVFAQTVSRRNPRVPELWVRGGGLPVCLCWGTGRCGRSPCGCMCCVPKPGWGAEASRLGSPKGLPSCKGPLPNLSYDLGGSGC